MNVNKSKVTFENNHYIFKCPHCKIKIMVKQNELNCKIFRCGILKSNYKQIPPHLKKKDCDTLKIKDLIFGCGKPFIFKGEYVEKCEYI